MGGPSQFRVSMFAAMLATIALGVCKAVKFSDDNREAWFKYMETQFHDENVPVGQQVSYAIGTGLTDIPELKGVMEERVAAVEQVASDGDELNSGGVTWEWFKDETTRISGESPTDLFLYSASSTSSSHAETSKARK